MGGQRLTANVPMWKLARVVLAALQLGRVRLEPFYWPERPKGVLRQRKARLLHDRAQLLRTLLDCRTGKSPDLSEPELTALVHAIERRLEDIERKLKTADLSETKNG